MTVPRFSNHSYTHILLRLHLRFVQSRMTMLNHRHVTCLHSLITHRAQRSDLLMTKIVNSWNDFDPLKHVIVGRADFSVIPPEEPATSEKRPPTSSSTTTSRSSRVWASRWTAPRRCSGTRPSRRLTSARSRASPRCPRATSCSPSVTRSWRRPTRSAAATSSTSPSGPS